MPGKQAAEKGAGSDAASTPSNYLTIRPLLLDSLISREDQIPAREGMHNNNIDDDDISAQPVLSDSGASGGY
jgi:hypothetical protein